MCQDYVCTVPFNLFKILFYLCLKKYILIVKATNRPRYVVGCCWQLDKCKLKPGTRVALDMTTLTITRYLPREVDPLVYNMSHEDPGNVSYSEIGGLSEQIRELREVGSVCFVLWTYQEMVLVLKCLKASACGVWVSGAWAAVWGGWEADGSAISSSPCPTSVLGATLYLCGGRGAVC